MTLVFQPIEYLRYHAAMTPAAIALQGPDRAIAFGDAFRRVRRIAHKLRNVGVAPGDVVLTGVHSRTADWLLTLALLHEATISCINNSAQLPDPALGIRWFVTDTPHPAWPAEQQIVLDKHWFDELPSGEITPRCYPSEQSICRLVLTSGTTGQAKAVPFSVDLLEKRLVNLLGHWCTAKPELNLMAMSSIGGLLAAFHALAEGTPYFICHQPADIVAMIHRFGIVNLTGSPMQLAEFARHAAGSGVTALPLELIRSAGGVLSESLLNGLERCTTARVMSIYGSTEATGIFSANADLLRKHPKLAGILMPNVECQIVDEHQRPLPSGEEGIIRVRALAMAREYYRNEMATRESFKDGWFYPGDTGRLSPEGWLFLSGRVNELLNCGGVKLDPVDLDHFVQHVPGVEDAVVFGYEDNQGKPGIAVALVVPSGFDFANLQRKMAVEFGRNAMPTRFMTLERVPRNAMGKPLRAELTRLVEQQERANKTVVL